MTPKFLHSPYRNKGLRPEFFTLCGKRPEIQDTGGTLNH